MYTHESTKSLSENITQSIAMTYLDSAKMRTSVGYRKIAARRTNSPLSFII